LGQTRNEVDLPIKVLRSLVLLNLVLLVEFLVRRLLDLEILVELLNFMLLLEGGQLLVVRLHILIVHLLGLGVVFVSLRDHIFLFASLLLHLEGCHPVK